MIEARNLTKKFDAVKALDNITLQISEGTVYGLVGSNGSGKSTLLRLIAGIYTPDEGGITVEGQAPFDNLSLKSQVFFLPDSPYFIHQSNLKEMAEFYRMMYPKFSKKRFSYLTTVFPLDVDMRINRMSKGMQRQAALLLALSCMPKVLLLDEAFDGLDPVIRLVLKQIISQSISEYGLTVIIASHNLRELEDLCDYIGLLHKGKVIFNSELDLLKSQIHKVQAAFKEQLPDSAFLKLDILKMNRQGSLFNMVVRGDRDEISEVVKNLDPLFFDILPPTLEEIFIYELEVTGYDVRSILN